MPNFVKLSCPTCNGPLEFPAEIDRFACAYCGNEHIVKRGGGIVTLEPVVQGLDRIRIGTDRTATEVIIRRVKEEIKQLRDDLSDLSYDATQSDQSGLLRILRTMKPEAYRELPSYSGSRHERDQRRCVELLNQLNPDESRALITRYKNENRSAFKTKTVESMLDTLEPLPELKERLQRKQAQLEQELKLADSL